MRIAEKAMPEEDMIKNVVFMGTPDFAVGTLQALIDGSQLGPLFDSRLILAILNGGI